MTESPSPTPGRPPAEGLAGCASALSSLRPDRVGALGVLYGLEPAFAEEASVLVIGRGAEQIVDTGERGRWEVVEGEDAEALERARGPFDYILAPRVLSWVDGATAEEVLAVVGRSLAPHGIAAIGYATLPGRCARQAVRELLLDHAGGVDSPASRVLESRAMLGFLARGTPSRGAWGMALREVYHHYADRSDQELLEDDLAVYARAWWFHELLERAARQGLQYLAEAEPEAMRHPSDEVQERIESAVRGRVDREQLLDLIVGRDLRHTLLCRSTPALSEPTADRLVRLDASCRSLALSGGLDLSEGVEQSFLGHGGVVHAPSQPMVKAALWVLARGGPRALPVLSLLDEAQRLCADAGVADRSSSVVLDFLLQGWRRGHVDLVLRASAPA